jgi:hypothetical protein
MWLDAKDVKRAELIVAIHHLVGKYHLAIGYQRGVGCAWAAVQHVLNSFTLTTHGQIATAYLWKVLIEPG